jgi:hypothetical protein
MAPGVQDKGGLETCHVSSPWYVFFVFSLFFTVLITNVYLQLDRLCVRMCDQRQRKGFPGLWPWYVFFKLFPFFYYSPLFTIKRVHVRPTSTCTTETTPRLVITTAATSTAASATSFHQQQTVNRVVFSRGTYFLSSSLSFTVLIIIYN